MSAEQSAAAIERWADCERAASKLGCGKTHVHDKLYSKLKAECLLRRVCEGDETAIAEVKKWPEFAQETVSAWSSDPDMPKSAMEKAKLAQWFIRKMGGVEKAKKAIDALGALQEALS